MNQRKPKVLDVGQCVPDHATITAMLEREFGASIDAAEGAAEARDALASREYDLVLVNRIFDADGDEGIPFIQSARSSCENIPFMLLSNFAEAQAAAVEAGAVRGFGKNAVDAPETRQLLEPHLTGERPQTSS